MAAGTAAILRKIELRPPLTVTRVAEVRTMGRLRDREALARLVRPN